MSTHCEIDGCTKGGRIKRGMCPKHYTRWRVHGDPMHGRVHPNCAIDGCPLRTTSRDPRCRTHVMLADKSGPHGLPMRIAARIEFGKGDECWTWTAHVATTGYGYMGWFGVATAAHRIIYQLLVGPIPEGYEIDHLCKNRLCVAPAHLEAVTRLENARRANRIGHFNAPRTCKRGHDWDEFPPQLAHRSNGTVTRSCAECARQRYRQRRAA